MISNLFDRLKCGESIPVRTLPQGDFPGGKEFIIRPAYWKSIVLGFTIEVDGKPVRDHRREIFDRAKMDDWAPLLEEMGI